MAKKIDQIANDAILFGEDDIELATDPRKITPPRCFCQKVIDGSTHFRAAKLGAFPKRLPQRGLMEDERAAGGYHCAENKCEYIAPRSTAHTVSNRCALKIGFPITRHKVGTASPFPVFFS